MKDLEKSRQAIHSDIVRLQKELAEIDGLVAGLKKRLATPDASATTLLADGASEKSLLPTSRFAGMSMRWAILYILGHAITPMSVGAVADALREGGFPNPEKIRANAGAVLSRLVSLNEVSNSGNSYVLTQTGHESLKNIDLPAFQLKPLDTSGESQESNSEGV